MTKFCFVCTWLLHVMSIIVLIPQLLSWILNPTHAHAHTHTHQFVSGVHHQVSIYIYIHLTILIFRILIVVAIAQLLNFLYSASDPWPVFCWRGVPKSTTELSISISRNHVFYIETHGSHPCLFKTCLFNSLDEGGGS